MEPQRYCWSRALGAHWTIVAALQCRIILLQLRLSAVATLRDSTHLARKITERRRERGRERVEREREREREEEQTKQARRTRDEYIEPGERESREESSSTMSF
jgi:hypothetical protein